jgi:hypothetical protein
LGKTARAPGPEKDYFNSWANKHLPGLNIDKLPSMSVMGSESARFGFALDEAAGIVESPFEQGRDVDSTGGNGSGLDKAAAAIETWLRGAFVKTPGTPVLGPRGRGHGRLRHGQVQQVGGDLIELADTNSDDGRDLNLGMDLGGSGLLSSSVLGSSSRRNVDGSLRGKAPARSRSKGEKAD